MRGAIELKRAGNVGGRSRKERPSEALDGARLDRLIEDATTDAYDEDEQRSGFHAALTDNVLLPFETIVLGVPVLVERIDLNDAGEIVAICRRGRHRQAIPLLALPLPMDPPSGSEWIEAYRRWARGR